MALNELSTKIHRSSIYLFIGMKEVNFTPVAPLGVYNLAGKDLVLDSKLSRKFPFYVHQFRSSVNIPWPEAGMGDADYIHAFQKIVMPIAMEFAPELVISRRSHTSLTPQLKSTGQFPLVSMLPKATTWENVLSLQQDMLT